MQKQIKTHNYLATQRGRIPYPIIEQLCFEKKDCRLEIQDIGLYHNSPRLEVFYETSPYFLLFDGKIQTSVQHFQEIQGWRQGID